MKRMVDIEVILDEECRDPKVTIRTHARTEQVESIIEAIESASDKEFPPVVGYSEGKIELLSQRDIIRVYTHARKVMILTEVGEYSSDRTMQGLEEILNPDRFVRISQSEIMNIYKVKAFEFDKAGTIGIEFENGVKTWASRSRVKAIKEMLREGH